MPKRAGVVLISVLAFIALAAIAAMGQDQTAKPAAKPVKVAGCVMPGKEEGCLIIKRGGLEYSLHFDPANKPQTGTAVSLEGDKMNVDTCMQGTPVKVTTWKPSPTKCAKPAASQ